MKSIANKLHMYSTLGDNRYTFNQWP